MNWFSKPIIYLSTGYITGEFFALISKIMKYSENKDEIQKLKDNDKIMNDRLFGFYLGVLGSAFFPKLYITFCQDIHKLIKTNKTIND